MKIWDHWFNYWDDCKGFIIIYAVYVVVLVTDFITTLMNKDILGAVEYNPVFTLTKSLLPLIIINIIALIFLALAYPINNYVNRFLMFNVMIIVIGMRLIAIYNAIDWINTPVSEKNVIELQKSFTPEVKNKAFNDLAFRTVVPILLNLLTVFFWKMDHLVIRRNKKESFLEAMNRT